MPQWVRRLLLTLAVKNEDFRGAIPERCGDCKSCQIGDDAKEKTDLFLTVCRFSNLLEIYVSIS